jgi:hypothetical protein
LKISVPKSEITLLADIIKDKAALTITKVDQWNEINFKGKKAYVPRYHAVKENVYSYWRKLPIEYDGYKDCCNSQTRYRIFFKYIRSGN